MSFQWSPIFAYQNYMLDEFVHGCHKLPKSQSSLLLLLHQSFWENCLHWRAVQDARKTGMVAKIWPPFELDFSKSCSWRDMQLVNVDLILHPPSSPELCSSNSQRHADTAGSLYLAHF